MTTLIKAKLLDLKAGQTKNNFCTVSEANIVCKFKQICCKYSVNVFKVYRNRRNHQIRRTAVTQLQVQRSFASIPSNTAVKFTSLLIHSFNSFLQNQDRLNVMKIGSFPLFILREWVTTYRVRHIKLDVLKRPQRKTYLTDLDV